MSKRHIKVALITIMAVLITSLIGMFTENVANDMSIELPIKTEIDVPNLEGSTESKDNEENSKDDNIDKSEDKNKGEALNGASETLINNQTKKDRRIAELTDKYNDSVYGHVAYYLEFAQKYSLPICFIGITMGAFNFLIIGNKKLDKKEQGFGWIVGFTIGLVVFNVIPLIFALFVAGR